MKISGFRFQALAVAHVGAIALILSLFAAPLKAQRNDAPELTEKAAAAIDKGLKHLLDNQRPDGSWAANKDGGRAVAITSLGLMAFMSKPPGLVLILPFII